MSSKKKNKIVRDNQDLWDSLEEQVGFLVNFCDEYDRGNFNYSKMIAARLRVLLHDTKTQVSLLHQLGRKENMKFCSTASFPKKAVYFLGLVNPVDRVTEDDFGRQQIEHIFIPNLNENQQKVKNWVDFDTWWTQNTIIGDKLTFSRKEMITFMTNQDGGAHIDPEVNEKYYKISKASESMLYSINGPLEFTQSHVGEPFKYLHYAMIRQIAHEIIISIRKEFNIRPSYNPSYTNFKYANTTNVMELLLVEGDNVEYER